MSDVTRSGQSVLVTAASKYGSTAEIARSIAEAIDAHGVRSTVAAPDEVESLDEYDAVVLGSAVYTGHWLRAATDFARRFERELGERPVWLFSSGPVGDPAGKLAGKMAVDPLELAGIAAATHARDHRMFAGKLDRKNLGFMQRAGLSLFRSLQGDFRDWSAIRSWAEMIAQELSVHARN